MYRSEKLKRVVTLVIIGMWFTFPLLWALCWGTISGCPGFWEKIVVAIPFGYLGSIVVATVWVVLNYRKER